MVARFAARIPTLALGRTCRLSTLSRLKKAMALCRVTCLLRRVSMASRHRSTIMMSSLGAPEIAEVWNLNLLTCEVCVIGSLEKIRKLWTHPHEAAAEFCKAESRSSEDRCSGRHLVHKNRDIYLHTNLNLSLELIWTKKQLQIFLFLLSGAVFSALTLTFILHE